MADTAAGVIEPPNEAFGPSAGVMNEKGGEHDRLKADAG